MRVVGRVISMGGNPLTEENMLEMFNEVCDDFAKKKFAEKGEVDVSYEIYGVGRFRANIFRQRGYIGMVFRHIHSKIPTMEELNLPSEQLRRLAMLPRGLVLVTGTAGSGKSHHRLHDQLRQRDRGAPHHLGRGSDRVHLHRPEVRH